MKAGNKKIIFGCNVTLVAFALVAPLSMSVHADNNLPGQGIKITPVFANVGEERFRGEIAIAGLKALGYDVQEPKETDYATIFETLAQGNADFTVHMWDKLHQSYYEKAGGDTVLIKVGTVIPSVLQGYLIDKKTAEQYNIHYLTDLKNPELAKLFDIDGDGKADLTGCDAGWGCQLVIDHQLKAYGLDETVTHHKGPYFDLMANTINRYKEGKPVLYYTWVPQWISGVLVEGKDVEWLQVPYVSLPDGKNDVDTTFQGKNLGFPVDQIKAVMNRNFAKKNIAASSFLSYYLISANDESAENLKMRNGENSEADIKRHAAEWIGSHQSQFDKWLEQARNDAMLLAPQ
ncbi:glycine betaine/L-proline ABC transporter substrate-binding protein ProX [Pokkaliibacter sp. MBI-7]|uniref:glycine betaine/L-proline ABC transporter substrate-binding protein ProX n=1 Tax=Pokkaliibacter sp. MBI-7 TaxID=3040600 RepID=UPI00244C3604|nr:glycine betaine/L-proline ABC transporter substrate-binding protein ProX [Pokkaliibacter sp. MBI-7]MDH2435668.1 glycine betaine/L-proline ABC transporter substrate-binding protein ProX [Pokkaliibacter sp. MBI-7]